MKTIERSFFVLVVTLNGMMGVYAAPSPPSPGDKKPPPPPGLAIDENIFFLLITAMLLGIYIVYKFKLKNKGINLN